MKFRSYTVFRKIEETPNTISIFLKAEDGGPLDTFRAGQHLSFEIGHAERRDYILSAYSAKPNIYRITVAHSSDHKFSAGAKYWTEITEGDVVRATGPSGEFHLPSELDRPILMLSKDIGEAAMTAIAEELAIKKPQHRAVFLHSTYNSATFALKAKLASLKADLPNADWRIWFRSPRQSDRASKEFDIKGEIDLQRHTKFFPPGTFDSYICGPTDFVLQTENLLRDLQKDCHKVLTAKMGKTISPPLEVIQEKELPPLEPRKVQFTRSAIEATWSLDRGTLLEFAESLGIEAPHSCRTGMCGKCAQKIVSGQVRKIRDTSAKIHPGNELLCSSVPITDVQIDM